LPAERWDRSYTILALKRRGHVVGYPGDGINDAPSFRSADVSISVETQKRVRLQRLTLFIGHENPE
jgi:P-type E1-E2 ATPase